MIDIAVTIGAAFFSGLAMYFFGYRRADKAQEVKEIRQRLADMKTAQEVRDEVEVLDDVDLANRASRWVQRGND